MSIGVESLFTSTLGLVTSKQVEKVDLDTTPRSIDFVVRCFAKRLSHPHCGAAEQPVHDRLRRSWLLHRHRLIAHDQAQAPARLAVHTGAG